VNGVREYMDGGVRPVDEHAITPDFRGRTLSSIVRHVISSIGVIEL
jgi:hypothetical protein